MVDLLLAPLLAVAALAQAVDPAHPTGRGLDTVGIALALMVGAPFAVHRRWPSAALWAVGAAAAALQARHSIPAPAAGGGATIGTVLLAVGVAVFFTTVRIGRCPTYRLLALTALAAGSTEILIAPADNIGSALAVDVLAVAAWALGCLVRARRAIAAEALEHAAALKREQVALARTAVVEERARIARELHDIVAHHVSVSDWLSEPERCSALGANRLRALVLNDRSRQPAWHVPPDAGRPGPQDPTEEGARRRLGAGRARSTLPQVHYASLIQLVSLMIVQAIAADRVQSTDPAKTHEMHAAIEATGRAAVAELRRLLELPRTEEDEAVAGRPPQLALADIPPLLDCLREAGLRVESTHTGTARPLPGRHRAHRLPGRAGRLANTLKHAGHTHAIVTFDWQPHCLTVTACDDGPLAPASGPCRPAAGTAW